MVHLNRYEFERWVFMNVNQTVIDLVIDDITRLSGYDAIVISTKSSLKSNIFDNAAAVTKMKSASLDAQVRTICGEELKKECEEIIFKLKRELHEGESVVTSAPKMNFKNIIHTVTPKTKDDGEDEFILESCYSSILSNAVSKGIRTVAIPAISTNHNGFSIDRATRIAVEAVKSFIKTYEETFDKISFVISDELSDFEELKNCYEKYLNAENIDDDRTLLLKIEIEKYNQEEIKKYLTGLLNEHPVIKKFVSVDVIWNSVIWSGLICNLLKSKIISIYSIFDWLEIDCPIEKTEFTTDDFKPFISEYLNDLRIKISGEKAYIFIDLKNVNITDLISKVMPFIKNKTTRIILNNINKADENDKKAVLESCLNMLFSNDVLQNIYSDILNSYHSDKIESLKKFEIKIGKIHCSKIGDK